MDQVLSRFHPRSIDSQEKDTSFFDKSEEIKIEK